MSSLYDFQFAQLIIPYFSIMIYQTEVLQNYRTATFAH